MNLTPWQILALCCGLPVVVILWIWAAVALGKLADEHIRLKESEKK